MTFDYDLNQVVYRVILVYKSEFQSFRFTVLSTTVDRITITRAGISYHTVMGGDNIKYDNVLYRSEEEAQNVTDYANAHIEEWIKKHKGWSYLFRK